MIAVSESGGLTKLSRKTYIDVNQRSLFNEGIPESGRRTDNVPATDEILHGREIPGFRGNVVSKYRPEYGTLPEVRIGFRDADSLRNRAVKAREERAGRLAAKGIRTSEEKGIDYALYNYAERDAVSTSGERLQRRKVVESFSKDFSGSTGKIRINRSSTPEREDLAKLFGGFNLEAVYWNTPKNEIHVNGAKNPADPLKNYINMDATNPLLVVLGHEVPHTLKI